jgi:DNA topoisomerase-3
VSDCGNDGSLGTHLPAHENETSKPKRKSNGRARKAGARKARLGEPKRAKDGMLLPDRSGADTPLRIPFGNKELALQLGAQYRSGGWYAPPGTDLTVFRQRGWL